MTPAELNHWAAEFMGWTLQRAYDDAKDVLVTVYAPLGEDCTYEGVWNPCESHDDCQRVIEKAIERGVSTARIFGHIQYEYLTDLMRKCLDNDSYASPFVLATAEQKLRAVYAAWMEKK